MEFSIGKKGFTLIELLVVIAIIGILTSIVFISLGGARSKARDAKRISDMRQLLTAQEMYYSDAEGYLQNDGLGSGVPAIGDYLDALHDPQAPTQDYGGANNTLDSQEFCAYAILEKAPILAGNTVYFCACHRGAFSEERASLPTLADCCLP